VLVKWYRHLTSSNATGNQWFLNGNPIGGATNQNYAAAPPAITAVTVTTTGCTSTPSAPNSRRRQYSANRSLSGSSVTRLRRFDECHADYGKRQWIDHRYNVLSVVPALTTAPTVNSSGVVSIH